MVRFIAPLLFASVAAVVARVEGADSALGKALGFGASLQDWKFLLAAFAFPAVALVFVLVRRRRDRHRPGSGPPSD